jgi:hypothetical protein
VANLHNNRVGNLGDSGVVEISDLTITNDGPTAGAILMQWNIHEQSKGSVAMWDTIFRIGGAVGTGLTEKTCHKYDNKPYHE